MSLSHYVKDRTEVKWKSLGKPRHLKIISSWNGKPQLSGSMWEIANYLRCCNTGYCQVRPGCWSTHSHGNYLKLRRCRVKNIDLHHSHNLIKWQLEDFEIFVFVQTDWLTDTDLIFGINRPVDCNQVDFNVWILLIWRFNLTAAVQSLNCFP